jgi:adenylate cyclase
MSVNSLAWLENETNTRWPIHGVCSIGRVAANDVVLGSGQVSRRHALIHAQAEDEFWLVDLGSSNGSFVSGRRVIQPTKLHDGDALAFDAKLTFHNEMPSMRAEFDDAAPTLRQIQALPCWLLVADIAGFTPLSQSMAPEELATMVGAWFSQCGELIERHGGTINKYLGDGFFAYWEANTRPAQHIAAALHELLALQRNERPAFRLAVHHGRITLGGTPSLGETGLLGPAVNFVFHMEKLAAALGERCLLSEAAHELLLPLMSGEARTLGRHPLKGFAGDYAFFSLSLASETDAARTE